MKKIQTVPVTTSHQSGIHEDAGHRIPQVCLEEVAGPPGPPATSRQRKRYVCWWFIHGKSRKEKYRYIGISWDLWLIYDS